VLPYYMLMKEEEKKKKYSGVCPSWSLGRGRVLVGKGIREVRKLPRQLPRGEKDFFPYRRKKLSSPSIVRGERHSPLL